VVDLYTLREAARQNIDATFGGPGNVKFSNYEAIFNLAHADNPDLLLRIANMTPEELRLWAEIQSNKGNESAIPADAYGVADVLGLNVADLGYIDNNGKWHNFLWYHGGNSGNFG